MNQFDSDKIRKLCAAHEEFRHHQGEFEIYRTEELTAAFDPEEPLDRSELSPPPGLAHVDTHGDQHSEQEGEAIKSLGGRSHSSYVVTDCPEGLVMAQVTELAIQLIRYKTEVPDEREEMQPFSAFPMHMKLKGTLSETAEVSD